MSFNIFSGLPLRQFWASVFLILSLGQPLALAETLDLETITQQAIERSFALKIAQVDVKIGKVSEKVVKADYYPTLKASLNMERLKSFQTQVQPVVAVNNTVLPYGTRFQNSVGVNAQYNLLDFGIRKRKLNMAQQETHAKAAVYFQTLRDLRLKLIDLYADALGSYRMIQANEAVLKLAQRGYQLKKRLYAAGTHSKVDVAEEAVQVAQAMDTIQVYREKLAEQLENLAYYTHETYDPQSVDLTDFQAEETNLPVGPANLENSPEARQLDAQITEKQAEIEMLQRQYLPQVSLYSYYNMYGSDINSWSKSVGNLAQRTVSLGLNVNLPLFDGFKNQASIQKAKLEQEKLRLQKEEKLAQLSQQVRLYQSQVEGQGVTLKTKATLINSTQDKLNLVERLSDKQVVDQGQLIKEHIARIQKQVDAEKVMIEQLAALKKLKILAEG